MNKEFTNISGILKSIHDIDISGYDASFFNKSLYKRIEEVHCLSAEDYCTFLENNIDEGRIFMESLQISYSEFFRNSLTFSVLERIILPSILIKKKNNRNKEIRVWSAACASGQEPYSLAMLFEGLKNKGKINLSYRIFATDSSALQVKEAIKGRYTRDAISNLTLKQVERWFTKHTDTYTIKPELKTHVDFSVFDLFSGQFSSPPSSIFGDFDIVLLANLLFYYKDEYRKLILEKAANCLTHEGFLVTGESERDILMKHNYHEVFPHSAIFQKHN